MRSIPAMKRLMFLPLLCTLLHGAPVELGKVEWERNYDKGIAAAKESGKPVFLLFQEVPG